MVELLVGCTLLFVDTTVLVRTILRWTHGELAEDPSDVVANYLGRLAHSLSASTTTFIAIYLLAHGLIKIALVGGLLVRKLWAYPLTLVIMLGFVAYQTYRLSHGFSMELMLLTVLDGVVTLLIWLEYRRLRQWCNASAA